jgi:uncharacterized repeat protein (TIGR01451 family)
VLLFIALSQLLVGQTPSAVSLFSAPNPATYGSAVTITATVTPSSATGHVTFYDGAAVLGVGTVYSGRARLMKPLPVASAHSIRAHYSGDTTYAPSDSAMVARAESHAIDSGRERPRTSTASIPGPYLISTIAGLAFPATSMPGTSAVLSGPGSVASDAAGDVYFADGNIVFRLDPTGTLTRVAGSGSAGFSGDNGPALSAQLWRPAGVALDSHGNLYIADSSNLRVRRVSPDGTITTVAGGGPYGYLGDNGPATSASILEPFGLVVDAAGNLFIADPATNRIRKVTANGIISTVAGNGSAGYSGDNGPATNAQLDVPWGVAVDVSGNLFVPESGDNRIRKVSASGTITTVAGIGTYGYSGDNGPATSAQLGYPNAVTVDASGNLYIADSGNYRVRKVSKDGTITTIAGNGTDGSGIYNGDGGEAFFASLAPVGVAADPGGNLYVADSYNCRIRRISAGIIATAAGGGSGDGAAAPMAMFSSPGWVAKDKLGNVYISDLPTGRVHQITPSGSISTVAGTGVPGYSGDYGPATSAQLNGPTGLAVDSSGALYIADLGNNRVRKVYEGTITTIAGTGVPGYSGDGIPASGAQVWLPQGLATDSFGNLYIADSGNSRIRKVAPGGNISTVAGNGIPGYSSDNVPATSAQLNYPSGVAVDSLGNLYIADEGNDRIRKVAVNGTITTIAGTGATGYYGDGGPATAALLNAPVSVAVDAAGNVYIADSYNYVIRVVTPGGIIATIAGTGSPYTEPILNGPALNAFLAEFFSATVDTTGNIYVADSINQVIRLLTAEGGPPVLTITCTHNGAFALNSTGEYTLTVSNLALAGPTNGTVTVTEFLPGGLSVSSMSGDGWDCNGNSCTTTGTLGSGAAYPPISVAVSVSPPAPSQVTNQVTVGGGGAAITGAQDLTVLTAPPTTIQTTPPGLQFSVDGITSQTAPQTLSLSPGNHTLSVPSAEPTAPGVQSAFTGWSDSGAATHTIDVTGAATTYTATFSTQYQLTTAAFPEPGGTVSPSSGAFYDAGTPINVTAAPISPYIFTGWSGVSTASSISTPITMTAPQSITANFAVPGFTCAVTGDITTSIADVQLIVNEALGIAAPNHDLNRDNVVNIADVQKVIEAAAGIGCIY